MGALRVVVELGDQRFAVSVPARHHDRSVGRVLLRPLEKQGFLVEELLLGGRPLDPASLVSRVPWPPSPVVRALPPLPLLELAAVPDDFQVVKWRGFGEARRPAAVIIFEQL